MKKKHLQPRSPVNEKQLCAGQNSGCEAAAREMQKLFDDDETEMILLIDAENAFNNQNRFVTLRNM